MAAGDVEAVALPTAATVEHEQEHEQERRLDKDDAGDVHGDDGGASLHSSAKSTARDSLLHYLDRLSLTLNKVSVESIGIRPLRPEERNSETWWSVSLVWFSSNLNILSFSTGTLAPLLGLNMKSALVTILLFSAFSSLFPAYFALFGSNLGIRQMVHARYSFGYFGAILICLLNAASMLGYCILNTIVGGQTLSAVSRPDATGAPTLTPTVGIVVASVIALVVSFSGIRVLHYFERIVWLPSLICFCILVGKMGTGPDGLHTPAVEEPTTARSVLAMGSILAGFIISYSSLISDVSHYLKPSTPSLALFLSCWAGFFFSCTPILMLGAAVACAAVDIPAWEEALAVSSGTFLDLILGGTLGGFGKFLQVLLALSVVGNISATIYSLGLTIQTMVPPLGRAPRFIWPLFAFAIFLPLAIVGASRFYTTLSNFTAVLGYWASLYVAVVLTDHWIVRRGRWASYDLAAWNRWELLPTGASAVGACALSLALVVPCIDQVWFVGPIAEKVGDLGFEVGLVLAAILYPPLRLVEKRLVGR
ncbi:uncharacterized protein PFL1_06068 [Pseudozyma flocculosa PF-1]|uniref:Related to purine-cytosine permease n=2 Tax=Pseudozyma flocculosa TaxID=84751 RepID=A0A5C3F4U6_9BASI|nr:uncharacterized protein PFL1_06068 [Pseudozyma flocculosa PF-1]EPQ26420.1 hypothetical protein PFL1_06068 [Pseudozyma flocculosa PF-1]SPO38986.1 related to purine-cytosine permease [Pseudozyma flocculosa]